MLITRDSSNVSVHKGVLLGKLAPVQRDQLLLLHLQYSTTWSSNLFRSQIVFPIVFSSILITECYRTGRFIISVSHLFKNIFVIDFVTNFGTRYTTSMTLFCTSEFHAFYPFDLYTCMPIIC